MVAVVVMMRGPWLSSEPLQQAVAVIDRATAQKNHIGTGRLSNETDRTHIRLELTQQRTLWHTW
jgi:hypothetical protein